MRRSMGRRGNNNNAGGGAGGPLMTGHLQDIDLELQLLKRKRDMIEQQQQLLVMEQQFKTSRHSYDPMRYDKPNQHGSNRDFTHLYESGPKHRYQFGRKRQAENQWQYDSAPNRIPPKKKNQNQSQFNKHSPGNSGVANVRNQRPTSGPNQGSRHSPRGPAPLMDVKVKPSIGQKIANQKAPPKIPRKDFTLSKVSKPKASVAPNKLASRSVTERKSLVAAACESSSDGDVSRILLPDRVPTQQVSGRLELALGAIMKNVRALIDSQPQNATVLRSIQLQRVMKQAVRERIRTVMLGKVVGSLQEILAVYREEFPAETDVDILTIALEAGGVLAPTERKNKTKFIESEDPGEFFKVNMSSLLESKLNQMFSKLEELYGGNAPPNDTVTPVDVDLQKSADNKNKDLENSQEYKDFLDTTIKIHEVKRILPRLMKRYIPYIVKLINVDAIYQSTKAAVTMRANQKAANIFGVKGPVESQGDAKTTAPASEAPTDNRLYNLPYYVKIMGRPTLPKRKVMQGFLSQFNPKSIKKHRTIHNLLFVGFTEKTDFDVIVGADGTVIGRNTLSVRICTKGPRESNGGNSENNVTSFTNDISQAEVKNEGQNNDDILTDELDFQITDLLSTIRKSEEESTNESPEKTDEKTDNNGGEDKLQAASEQAENDSDENKAEERGVNNDEEMVGNADVKKENVEEIVDNNVTDENLGDDNTGLQEDADPDEVDTQNTELANGSDTQNTEITEEANTQNPAATEEAKTQNSEDSNENQKSEVIDIIQTENSDNFKKESLQDTNEEETQMDTQEPPETTSTKTEEQSNDKVGELKSNATGRSTPSRMSARLANVTPSTIRTRRASKLASQN